jgi:type IV secretory pathway VirB2 component (pilin)
MRDSSIVLRRAVVLAVTFVLIVPFTAFAQGSPWERAANNLATTFTGPLARSLALVSIVIGGLLFMFGEQGAKRQISGIVFGGGLALFVRAPQRPFARRFAHSTHLPLNVWNGACSPSDPNSLAASAPMIDSSLVVAESRRRRLGPPRPREPEPRLTHAPSY